MSYFEIRQKCNSCGMQWPAMFGIVGTSEIGSRQTKCPQCGSTDLCGVEANNLGEILTSMQCDPTPTPSGEAYKPLRMMGRCCDGAERDSGTLAHAVPLHRWAALCGKEPGRRSAGWSEIGAEKVSCPRCLRKIEKMKGEIA